MNYLQFQDDSSILKELLALTEKNVEEGLEHLQSLAGLYQYRSLYKLFHKYVPLGVKVLDWGVGKGHFSYFLVRAGYKAFGFSLEDGFPNGVNLADAPYHFVPGNIKEPIQLPFADNSFEAVASVGVLEHVRETGGDDKESLREITRILKPGGVFICYHLPNRYSLIDKLSKHIPDKHHHPFRYTGKDINTLCESMDLKLLETKRYGFLPRNGWQHAPTCMRRSKALALTWDILDKLLAYPFISICQNYFFVARKPENVWKNGE